MTNRSTRDIARLGAPIAVRGLSFAALGVIDTMFTASLGIAALAGVGLAGTIAFTVLVPVVAFLTAIKVCVAQRRGAGLPPAAPTATALRFALLAAPVVMVLLGLAAMGTPVLLSSPAAGAAARTYLLVRVLGVPAAFVATALREHFYGMEDSVTPMRAFLYAMVLNVAFNAVAIGLLDQGVWAIAAGTILARALSTLYLARHVGADIGGFTGLLRTARRQSPERRREMFTALRAVGTPFAAQRLLESAAFAFVAAVVAGQGDADAATHELAIRILLVGVLPCHAIGDAVSVLGGDAYQAGDLDVRSRLFRAGASLALPWTIGAGALAWAIAPALLNTLSLEPAQHLHLVWALRLAGLLLTLEGSSLVAQGLLRATGEAKFASMVVGTNASAVTPAVVALGVWACGLGVEAAWGAFCLEVIVTNIFLLTRMGRAAAPELSPC